MHGAVIIIPTLLIILLYYYTHTSYYSTSYYYYFLIYIYVITIITCIAEHQYMLGNACRLHDWYKPSGPTKQHRGSCHGILCGKQESEQLWLPSSLDLTFRLSCFGSKRKEKRGGREIFLSHLQNLPVAINSAVFNGGSCWHSPRGTKSCHHHTWWTIGAGGAGRHVDLRLVPVKHSSCLILSGLIAAKPSHWSNREISLLPKSNFYEYCILLATSNNNSLREATSLPATLNFLACKIAMICFLKKSTAIDWLCSPMGHTITHSTLLHPFSVSTGRL